MSQLKDARETGRDGEVIHVLISVKFSIYLCSDRNRDSHGKLVGIEFRTEFFFSFIIF